MCLVALAIDQSRRFPLVVASNRDDDFERSTARLAWWSPRPGDPPMLGGRDLESGGTWLGLTAQGRLALLTNVRTARPAQADAPSRGTIVSDWLSARESSADFWTRTALSGHNGFNLIAADFLRGDCFWASNLMPHAKRLEGGVYGLSNGTLDAPWPKVVGLKAALLDAMDAATSVDELATALFGALADRNVAADNELPHTGVPIDWERQLSAAFIRTPDQAYGTRCSTLIITERVGRSLVTHILERTFSATGAVALLRRASIRNWPPRYQNGAAPAAAEPAAVSESELAAGPEIDNPPKRTRMRSLLPAPQRRPKRLAFPSA